MSFRFLFLILLLPPAGWAAFEGMCIRPVESGFFAHLLDDSTTDVRIRLARTDRFGLPELAIDELAASLSIGGILTEFRWRSSGDELYRENIIRLTGDSRWKSILFGARISYYGLRINNYGNTGSLGAGLHAGLEPFPELRVLAGLDDFAFDVRVRDRRLLPKTYWVVMQAFLRSDTRLTGFLETNTNADPGLGVELENRVAGWISGRLLLADLPVRYGVGASILYNGFFLQLDLINTVPLGWSQRFGIGYAW